MNLKCNPIDFSLFVEDYGDLNEIATEFEDQTRYTNIRALLTDSPIIWRIANIFGDLQNYWRTFWRSPIILEISNSPIFLAPNYQCICVSNILHLYKEQKSASFVFKHL